MNEGIMRTMGYNKEVKLAKLGLCPICSEEILHEEFRDNLSKKEYRISGICQACQDKIFIEPEEEKI